MKIIPQQDFELPPEGLLVGTLKKIEDLGVQPDPFNPGKTRHQIKTVFALDLGEGKTVDQNAWFNYSKEIRSKNKLYKLIRALEGGKDPKPGTQIELDDYLGRQLKLQIEYYKVKGQTRSRPVGYYPIKAAGPGNGHGPEITDEDLPENLR